MGCTHRAYLQERAVRLYQTLDSLREPPDQSTQYGPNMAALDCFKGRRTQPSTSVLQPPDNSQSSALTFNCQVSAVFRELLTRQDSAIRHQPACLRLKVAGGSELEA